MTISKTYTVRYHSALPVPCNLLPLSYRTTTGITKFTLHCCQYIHQPRILSTFIFPPGQSKPESKVAVDSEGYRYQVQTKTLKDGCKRAPHWCTLRYGKQGSEMGVYFRSGPTLGEHGWAFLSSGLLIGGILLGSLETSKCPMGKYFSP